MNVARRAPFSLGVSGINFRRLGILNLVSLIGIACLFDRVNIQKFSGCFSAGKFFYQPRGSLQPTLHTEITADIRESVLERICIPNADAVALLESFVLASLRQLVLVM